MNFWNLIIVLCFSILYLGLVLVYLELRRLRDEIKIHHASETFPEPGMEQNHDDQHEQQDEEMVRELHAMTGKMGSQLELIYRRMRQEFEEVHHRLHAMDVRLDQALAAEVKASLSPVSSGSGNSSEDRHQKAMRMLQRGVPEESVINETNLSVEEVSLLKHLTQQSDKPSGSGGH